MGEDASTSRIECRYGLILPALVGGVIVQGILLPSLARPSPFYDGSMTLYVAGAVDVIVFLQIAIARIRRRHIKAWRFYSALPYGIVPVLLWVAHLWGP